MTKITEPMNIFISLMYLFFHIFISYSMNLALDKQTSDFGSLIMILVTFFLFILNYITFNLLSIDLKRKPIDFEIHLS